MSTISASTTSTTAYKVTADTTGALVLQTGATPTTAVTIDTSQNTTLAGYLNAPNTFGFKNRIINGAMVIDQRNAGASVTPVNIQYSVDRWQSFVSAASKFTIQQNAGSVTPPTGFTNYLGATSSSAYSLAAGDYFTIQQRIEGYNVSDLNFGKASAATITVWFWVRSSLTGTFGGALSNGAQDRGYPFTYTISSANTWEQKSVTIAGDTSGTWITNNGIGMFVIFSLGTGATYSGTAGAWAGAALLSATGATSVVGTNGATWYVTGVQLEKGSTATSFDYRPYGTELALCQRYYFKMQADDTAYQFAPVSADSATRGYATGTFPVTLRTTPSALEQSGTASQYTVRTGGVDRASSTVPAFASTTTQYVWVVETTVASGQTAGLGGIFYGQSTSAYLGWSAEL